MGESIWRDRMQSAREEIANSISHGVGLVGALAVTPVLIVVASRSAGAKGVVVASIFGATMILMYLTSTLYHALPVGRAKRVFRTLDHAAIYVLIAGTYTPITLVVLGGSLGWWLFGSIWGTAVVGIALKVNGRLQRPFLSTTLYVIMGLSVIVVIKPLWIQMPLEGMIWLGVGGVAYLAGIVFYAATGLRYSHLIWHIFVLAGTSSHFVAVLKFAV